MGKGLRKPLLACFSIIIFLILVIIGISIRGFRVVYSNSHLVISDVVPLGNASSSISISLLTLETSLRGYALTKDPNYLQTSNAARKKLATELSLLKKYSSQLDDIREHVDDLLPQVHQVLDEYDRSIRQVPIKTTDIEIQQKSMTSILATLRLLDNDINSLSHDKIRDSELTKADVTDILIAVSVVVFLLIAAIIAMVFEIINENINHNQKQKKSLENTLKEQEEFYANITHELKTPLNVILSTLQLLELYNRSKPEPDRTNMLRYLKIMKQNCYRLSRLSNNMIDITKIESGYVKLKLESDDIIHTVEDIVQSVVEFGKSKGVTLLFDTDVEEKVMAYDHDKLERILLNLLSNAFKFTNPGDEITVFVQDQGAMLSISVSDSGIGIPSDKIDVIFDRFKQVDKSLARNAEGSGIGLALTKSLVEMHRGTISATSDLGVGSSFMIELPVGLATTSDHKASSTKPDNHAERITIEFSDIYFD